MVEDHIIDERSQVLSGTASTSSLFDFQRLLVVLGLFYTPWIVFALPL